MEVEVGDGQIELEIEFKWPTAPSRTAPSQAVADTKKAPRRKSLPAKPGRSSAGTSKSKSPKRSATKTP